MKSLIDIEVCYTLPFPVEIVFAAWLSNEFLVAPVTSIEVNPKVGGVFRLRTGLGEAGDVMEGEILRFEENRSIRYTWHWGGDGAPSIVNAIFSTADGQTQVNISHSGLQSSESAREHRDGWDGYIVGLMQKLGENVASM